MNWIGLKVTNPKKFKKLDILWRKANAEYLRKYNSNWRRKSRARKG